MNTKRRVGTWMAAATLVLFNLEARAALTIDFADVGGSLFATYSGSLSGTYDTATGGTSTSTTSDFFHGGLGQAGLFHQRGSGGTLGASINTTTSGVSNFSSLTTLNILANAPTINISSDIIRFSLTLTQASNSIDSRLAVLGDNTTMLNDPWSATFSGGQFNTGLMASDFVLDGSTRVWDFGGGNVVALNLGSVPVPEPSSLFSLSMVLLLSSLGSFYHRRRKNRPSGEAAT